MRLIYIILITIPFNLFCQDSFKGFYHSSNKSMIPKSVLNLENQTIVPYSLLSDGLRNPGIAFFSNDSLYNSIIFEGPNEYVINQVINSDDGNLLVSAEGYSDDGQESIYFMELNENEIVNSFIFNENGNEVDPFGILEIEKNILISGFIKERELINNSFFNMYSEKQEIYLSEFTKNGDKIWSKAIKIEGYNSGISNAIIKYQNDIIMLCHAKDKSDILSSFLVRLKSNGDIISITKLSHPNTSLTSNIITTENNEIKLVGTYREDSKEYLFSYYFDSSLNLTKSYEYNIPYSFVLNTVNGKYCFGGMLSNNEGYNNLILELHNGKAAYSVFGSIIVFVGIL